MITDLPKGFALYRSDINEPPETWNKDFINPTYNYNGFVKNLAGNLFFFDNESAARKLGKTYAQGYHYLTACNINIDDCRIIDFSECGSVYMMIRLLDELGIQVMTDDFKLYMESAPPHEATFREFSIAYDKAKAGDTFSAVKVKFPGKTARDIDIFGQRLTDFNNGIIFKELIDKMENPIHGYRWTEQDAAGIYSYCIFSPSTVSEPGNTKEVLSEINSDAENRAN